MSCRFYRHTALISALLTALLSVILFAACGDEYSERASFEELMKNGMAYPVDVERILFTNFSELDGWYNEHGWKYSVVSGRVKTVRYYHEWTGYHVEYAAVCEIKVDGVSERFNSANIKTGDTVRVLFGYGPTFCKDGRFDEAREMEFLSKKLGFEVESELDLKGLDPFAFELIPKKDGEYMMCTGWEMNTVPMEEGKKYALFISEPEESKLYGTVCRAVLTYPLDETPDELTEKYGLRYDPYYLKIGAEMARIFK